MDMSIADIIAAHWPRPSRPGGGGILLMCECGEVVDHWPAHVAEAISGKFGVVPLDCVTRWVGVSSVVFEPDTNNDGTISVQDTRIWTQRSYWNLAQGDDPTPAIAAMILAMREAQGEL